MALVLAITAPFVQTLTAQGATRYTLTAAILEQGTIELDDYAPIVGIDRVERDGHLYSDKAPGQPFLGVPVLAAAYALGAQEATEFRVRGNLGLWSQTLVFCSLAGAALTALMWRHAHRSEAARSSIVAALGLGCTTMLLPFSSALYGHVFAGLLGFGAWHLVSTPDARLRHVALGGLLAGLAVVVEYPMALLAALLFLWLVTQRRWRDAMVLSLAGAPSAALLLIYNLRAYGSFSTGYSSKPGSSGRLNFFRIPDPSHAFDILFGPRGFVFTPIVLVGIVAMVLLVRRRPDLVVPAAFFGGLFLLQAGWSNPWGGDGPGPRYIAPAIPFLATPVAFAVGRLRPVIVGTALAVGAVAMGAVLITYELMPVGSTLIVTHLRYALNEPGLNPTVFTMAIGPVGWVLHAGLVGLSGVWVARSSRA